MKKTLLSFVLFSVLVLKTDSIWAQQDPYNTHYAFNRMLYNPAVAGSKDKYCVTALSHYQYLGYEDRTVEFWPSDPNDPNSKPPPANKSVGPKTQMFSVSAPITKYGGLGIGFIKDKLGYESSTHVKVDAAGRLPLKNGATISVGFEANFLQKGINGTQLRPLAPFDPSIPNQQVSDNKVVFGAGAYYINPLENSTSMRDLWVSVSSLNLNHPNFEFGGGTTRVFSTPKTHTYIMGGVTLPGFLGNQDLNFHPSLMVKQNAVWQVDATALVEYQNKLWGGLAYRTTADAVSIMLGYSGFKGNFQGLRIGYSYDLTLTKILSVSSGTHELQLNYCFEIKRDPPERINLLTPPFMNRTTD
jgi:type IX secretion system PorP/SprF family membrane protein